MSLRGWLAVLLILGMGCRAEESPRADVPRGADGRVAVDSSSQPTIVDPGSVNSATPTSDASPEPPSDGAEMSEYGLEDDDEVSTKSIDDLLRIRNSLEFCDAVNDRLTTACEGAERQPSHDVEFVVLLTYEATGVVSNGGMKYLLESDFHDERDPGFVHTADALRIMGAQEMHSAFMQLISWFPDGVPSSPEERLLLYEQIPAAERERADNLCFDNQDKYFRQLAKYIRANQSAINDVLKTCSRRRKN